MADGTMLMLEREREFADCAAALERALTGFGGMLVVEGPAGIGKTELLRAAAAQASVRGLRVLQARGLEVECELAFGGVRQLLEPVLRKAPRAAVARLLSGSATPARRLLASGFAAPSVGTDPEFAMLNALYWVLAHFADAKPLALVIDDAHWLDPPSLRLLDFLLPRIEGLRVLVLLATREPQEGGDDGLVGRLLVDPASRVIRLGPLSRDAVFEFVRARLGEEPAPAFVDACAEVTGGNPFYLGELLRDLARRGAHPVSGEAVAVRMIGPRSIALTLRFRDATSVDGIKLARALAVLGDGARFEDVAAVASLERDAAVRIADALTRQAILSPGPKLSFAHPIVRTAVYADLGPRERAMAHARAARILHSTGAPVERVAAQLMNTDPAGDPVVAEVLRAAATAAFSQGAPDTAAQYLRRARAEPPDETVRARILLELGRAEASTVHPDAPANLAEAFAVATDPATRADAAIQGARTLIIAGRIDKALAMLAAFADEIAGHDPGRALELEAALAALATWDLSAAALHRHRLERVDEDMAADSLGARMMLCQLAYQRTWRSQDATRAAELVERALADGLLMIERGPEAPELASAAMTLICGDCLQPAAALLDGALEQAREQGSRYGFANVSFLRSELAYRQGALADAEADAHASLVVFGGRAGTQIGGFAVASGMLITALLERGRLDEAKCALEEAAKALGALGLASDELPQLGIFNLFLSARGRLRLALGDLAGGLHDLHECGRRNAILEIRNPVLIPWRVDAALAHRARGELDAARALSEEELAAARDWGTPGTIGVAQRVAGLLAHGDEAITLLQEATAALAVSPARLEHARALIDLGAAQRRANRRAEAREPLTRGLDLADKCGANMLCRRALDELAATGAHPRRRRLTGIDALTASERRVAQMAARGLGNIEIAQTLFVTRKTVEKHLSNAYTKLGVNSRAALTTLFPV